mmetsp:Transcript_22647/g.62993  ORF Transcript_22647/g.62993 Transcript_22647/m.62993 type:complete len:102 (+) Transcript_22647:142-447(+)
MWLDSRSQSSLSSNSFSTSNERTWREQTSSKPPQQNDIQYIIKSVVSWVSQGTTTSDADSSRDEPTTTNHQVDDHQCEEIEAGFEVDEPFILSKPYDLYRV